MDTNTNQKMEVFKLLLEHVYETKELRIELGPISPIGHEKLSDLEEKVYNHFICNFWL